MDNKKLLNLSFFAKRKKGGQCQENDDSFRRLVKLFRFNELEDRRRQNNGPEFYCVKVTVL